MVPPIDLSGYREIVVLTGAGISVASGLPTYRGHGGLWTKAGVQDYATAAAMEASPEAVWAFFAELRTQAARAAPNPAHLALALTERRLTVGQRLTILTQNVDPLHLRAGSTRVLELHGTLQRDRCTKCDYSVEHQPSATMTACPRCPTCGAAMRPAVVLFDEPLDVDVEWASKKVLRDCDLFVAVGTSGTVSPASNFVRAAAYAGARTIYVNLEPMVPHNPAFQEVHLGRAEELLPQLFGASN